MSLLACILLELIFSTLWCLPTTTAVFSNRRNWTIEYGNGLAEMALDFAAAAYAKDPSKCMAKNGAQLIMRLEVPCDAISDECWAFIAVSANFIVFSVRGTRTKAQLIVEIVESMTEPKISFPAGGSVQHYFYKSLQAIWTAGFEQKLREIKQLHPNLPVLFTGHSLGAAIVSLASTQFAMENNQTVGPNDLLLITFGQPRVGNILYARAHDRLVPNSFRLVHRYDIVPHLPYCYQQLFRPHNCIPLLGHGPFHHGTEIWYPSEDMEPHHSLYVICDRQPFGEDKQCSNAHILHLQVRDHLAYFGKDVDGYGTQGCEAPVRQQFSSIKNVTVNDDNNTYIFTNGKNRKRFRLDGRLKYSSKRWND